MHMGRCFSPMKQNSASYFSNPFLEWRSLVSVPRWHSMSSSSCTPISGRLISRTVMSSLTLIMRLPEVEQSLRRRMDSMRPCTVLAAFMHQLRVFSMEEGGRLFIRCRSSWPHRTAIPTCMQAVVHICAPCLYMPCWLHQ